MGVGLSSLAVVHTTPQEGNDQRQPGTQAPRYVFLPLVVTLILILYIKYNIQVFLIGCGQLWDGVKFE